MKTTRDYIKRLTEIYADIPASKSEIGEILIQRLADVLVMMDECKAQLTKYGCMMEQNRGNYTITKENPASKLYDAKHKLMLSTMDKLDKLLPEDGAKKDELMAYLDSDAD